MSTKTTVNYDAKNKVSNIKDRLLYSYKDAMEGFAASLTKDEATTLREMDEVITLFEDTLYELQTTRTPSFLNLIRGKSDTSIGALLEAANKGQNVIIGMLDSGIWPEHESFKDDGYPPIPARWKGSCDNVPTFTGHILCNRKIIGARSFSNGVEGRPYEYKDSVRDNDGHGTYTASIVAGNVIQNANVFGYASGEASGMAPNACLAIYKVCRHNMVCRSTDVLAGFDAAISDGVDILPLPFMFKESSFLHPMYIATLKAEAKGIIIVGAASNKGPKPFTVNYLAPWVLTVGISTIDRDFPATLTLGNGIVCQGVSRYTGVKTDIIDKEWPLVFGGTCNGPIMLLVGGAIVLCWDDNKRDDNGANLKGSVVQKSGGVGMVYVIGKEHEHLIGMPAHDIVYEFPTVVVQYEVGKAIREYLSMESMPSIRLGLKSGNTRVGFQQAPSIPSDSSRGPNKLIWEVMKPDIIAPGVEILGAWNTMPFTIDSGSSTGSAHVAGITALLKGARPTWSPPMIRSAIITTAYTLDNRGKPIIDLNSGNASSPIAMGAGHVNPNVALEPGLVYNSDMEDYVNFLCSIGYDSTVIHSISPMIHTCISPNFPRGHLNHPSFSIVYNKSQAQIGYPSSFKFYRTLTNVSPYNSNYTVSIAPPLNVGVIVEPKVLSFQYLHHELSYSISFTPDPSMFEQLVDNHQISHGSITWEDNGGKHKVRNPIMFTWYVDK